MSKIAKTNNIKKSQKIIEDRKKEAIDITLQDNVQSQFSGMFEYVHIFHNALPEINMDEIDTTCSFLERKFSSPILIDCMTGGTNAAYKINSRLAEAACEFDLPLGIGSQRAGLKSKSMAKTYSIMRKKAPDAFIMGNIGGAQLAEGLDLPQIRNIIEMIDANALAIHLNPLQELIQPEGEPNFRGVLKKIKEISQDIGIPIIVKEVGSGISADVAKRLERNGVSAINVSGLGGTSWAGVEKIRAQKVQSKTKSHLGTLFWNWGIPTAASLINAKKSIKLPLISSGGLRNGLDVAKSLVLGATLCGFAHPMLTHSAKSYSSLQNYIETLNIELRSTMFLLGCKNIQQLSNTKYVISEPLRTWTSLK